MPETPVVLLIDDGELGEVRALLDELGVGFEHIVGAKHRGPLPEAGRLLITTSRLAMALQCRRSASAGGVARAVWIAFLAGESKTQRQVLERAGFDFMVRQPVHPAALRLLLLRALYEGDESRRVGRVAFGYEVSLKLGLRSHKATLTDLSPGGCRLLFSRPLEKRQEVSIRIPAEVAGGRRLDLLGVVVRSGAAENEGGANGESAYGVRFERMTRESRDRLRDVLLAHSSGPAVLRAAVQTPRASAPKPSLPARGELRAHLRRSFGEKVTAIGGTSRAETHHVLLGRNISPGGMLVEPESGLAVNDEIRLAIQPQGSSDPILVEATIVRDDGPGGLALRFDWMDAESQQRLAELTSTLPSIEALQTESASGTVLSRMLSSFRKP